MKRLTSRPLVLLKARSIRPGGASTVTAGLFQRELECARPLFVDCLFPGRSKRRWRVAGTLLERPTT